VRVRQMRVVRKLYLVYRRDRPLTAAAQELVEIIRNKPRAARAAANPSGPRNSL